MTIGEYAAILGGMALVAGPLALWLRNVDKETRRVATEIAKLTNGKDEAIRGIAQTETLRLTLEGGEIKTVDTRKWIESVESRVKKLEEGVRG